jgi:hypothetical protein
MRTVEVEVARTIGELAGLPDGTRIATNHNRLLVLEDFNGLQWWHEEGELQNYTPLVHWLPAFILPPAVEQKADIEPAQQGA